MTSHELIPRYINQKSFYNKATVIKENNAVKLKSYETIVAEYFPLEKRLKINGWYSSTTAKHINEFILQWAPFFSTMKKSEMIKKPVKTL